MSLTFFHKYLRWGVAGLFKNSLYYVTFLFMFYMTENKHLSYWSWILVSPFTYHIWKCVETHDTKKWLNGRVK